MALADELYEPISMRLRVCHVSLSLLAQAVTSYSSPRLTFIARTTFEIASACPYYYMPMLSLFEVASTLQNFLHLFLTALI
jgi:hypothetical protein